MKKVIFVFAIAAVVSGCSATSHVGQHFTMSGTPDGIRAFGDTLVGSMKTAKESSDSNNQYFAHRNEYERNITTRETQNQPGFLQKLFGAKPSETQGS